MNLESHITYIASDGGVNLAATFSPKTRGYNFERVRFEKLMPEPCQHKNHKEKEHKY